jgi:endonuclease-8
MPEGDTIFRAARTLQRALAGKPVVFFESMLPALDRLEITGRTIDRVSTAGKHILMHFSGDLVLRTHMRMNGSWHIYRRGERWLRPRRDMRLVIATDEFEAVGFSIPEAELIATRDLQRHDTLRKLGPDLLADTFDAGEALRRLRGHGNAAVADALLNQRVMAGIGNVYKSEVLFLCRVNPFTAVHVLDDTQLASIVETARRLLRVNVSEGPALGNVEGLAAMTTYTGFRRTTGRDDPKERLWVYGRARLPCRRCGTPISINKQGADARLTYWCPACQDGTEAGSNSRTGV